MMRFKKHKENTGNVLYPEDVRRIRQYLNNVGDLTATDEEIDWAWSMFSEDLYFAGWMKVDDRLLEEFADWLEDWLKEKTQKY